MERRGSYLEVVHRHEEVRVEWERGESGGGTKAMLRARCAVAVGDQVDLERSAGMSGAGLYRKGRLNRVVVRSRLFRTPCANPGATLDSGTLQILQAYL